MKSENHDRDAFRDRADFSVMSDAQLKLEEAIIEERRAWALEDNDKIRATYYEQQMRALNAERMRRNSSLELDESPARVFPNAAWRGLFARWRDVIAESTEASLESLWAAFLIAAGLVVGRSVYRESPRPVYSNFFVLLVGETSDSRKSTVLWFISELLHKCGEDFKELHGVQSSEAIYEALSERERTKALIYADEFRAFLNVASRRGTQDIIPRLNSLYSCPARSSIDRRKESTTIVEPFVALMTATPRSYVEDIISDLEIAGGFLNRMLIVAGAEQPPRAIVKNPSPAAWESIAAPLRAIRDRVTSAPATNFEMTREAEQLWIKFYETWKNERRANAREKHLNLTARTHEHVLKIALVYAALANEREISAHSLAIAIELAGWLESNAIRLFADASFDRFTKCERAILELLKNNKNRAWRRELQQRMSGRGYNAELFNRAIKALEENDLIACSTAIASSGQSRSIITRITS